MRRLKGDSKRMYRWNYRTVDGVRQKRREVYNPSSDKTSYTQWRRIRK